MSWLSCSGCQVPAVLSRLSCPSCPVPAVLSRLLSLTRLSCHSCSCPGRPFSAVRSRPFWFWLSSLGCHVQAVLSRLSCAGYPVQDMSCLPCPVPTVLFNLSCPSCPVLGFLSWLQKNSFWTERCIYIYIYIYIYLYM
jgi:hypothetical protein